MRRVTGRELGLHALEQRHAWLTTAHLATLTAILLVAVAAADWLVGHVSLGVLYIIPMVVASLFLEPLELAGMAILCAFLRSRFDYPGSSVEVVLRFIFAAVSYWVAGAFVSSLVENRRMMSNHLHRLHREQALRREIEEQLKSLVASSPAAIFTLDAQGKVIAANQAANALFGMRSEESLLDRDIAVYLPVLRDALRLAGVPDGFRTSAQSLGYRVNGEIFQAHTWFSSYETPEGLRLAAIVVDSSEEMRDREESSLQEILRSNRIATAGVFHELRNLCSAIAMLCRQVADRHGLDHDRDLEGVVNLIQGVQRMADPDFAARTAERVIAHPVQLKQVFENLRVVIETDWQESNATLLWEIPAAVPPVMAEAHVLLQAFLNLSKNSLRAVQACDPKILRVSLLLEDGRVTVRFEDSGPGIADSARLFQPFQQGAEGTGLGLYLSRAVLRSYGGDLRFEPRPRGCCFAVDLELA